MSSPVSPLVSAQRYISLNLANSFPLLKLAALVALVASGIWAVYKYFFSHQLTALPKLTSDSPADYRGLIDGAIYQNGGYEKWRKHAKDNAFDLISNDDVRAYYVYENALKTQEKELASKHLNLAHRTFELRGLTLRSHPAALK